MRVLIQQDEAMPVTATFNMQKDTLRANQEESIGRKTNHLLSATICLVLGEVSAVL
jgi:hypothetical protein